MLCRECDRLQTERDRLERVYAQALGLLLDGEGRIVPKAYDELRGAARDARLTAEFAWVELERHKRTHG